MHYREGVGRGVGGGGVGGGGGGGGGWAGGQNIVKGSKYRCDILTPVSKYRMLYWPRGQYIGVPNIVIHRHQRSKMVADENCPVNEKYTYIRRKLMKPNNTHVSKLDHHWFRYCCIAHWAFFSLTHWGRVTHICVCKLTIIGSDNGSSPGRRQAIIWTNAGILLIVPLGANFSEIFIEILTFSFKKMRFKVSSAKWRPFCLGLNGWTHTYIWWVSSPLSYIR